MVSSTRIRMFRWTDLEEFVGLFNCINGKSHTQKAYDLALMRQFLSQPSCDPERDCYLAESKGSLVGFTLIAPELPIGRAVASGGVVQSQRRRGVGRMLVKQAIQHAKSIGSSVLHIQLPERTSDAHRILSSEGFYTVRTYHRMWWEGKESPLLELPPGFSIRPFVLGRDEKVLTQLQNIAFAQNWGFCPNTVEEIKARVRFNTCDPEGIILIEHQDRTSAYNWTLRTGNNRGSTGTVSMTGVHPDYRGRRLGAAVVVAGMSYLIDKGVKGIELEVDADNAPAMGLYRKLGFNIFDAAVWHEKKFNV